MPPHERTDGELLRSARCDPEAFGELYLRYEPIVAGYLQRRARDPELTADLTAETFATALLRADPGGEEPVTSLMPEVQQALMAAARRRARPPRRRVRTGPVCSRSLRCSPAAAPSPPPHGGRSSAMTTGATPQPRLTGRRRTRPPRWVSCVASRARQIAGRACARC